MKFFGILSTLFVSAVVALPTPSNSEIVKRDAAAIISSIKTLEADTVKLNTSVTNFNPVSLTTIGGLLDVLKNSNQVGNDIIATTKTTKAAGVLNSSDSLDVALEFLNFVPQVQSLIDNLIASRSKVDSVGAIFSARKTVLSALQNDKKLSADLITATTNALDEGLRGAVPEVADAINAAFDKGIQEYSTKRKGIELPAIPSNVKNGQVVNY